MSERVHALGGVMRVEPRPEGGTRVLALLPLPEVEEREG
jgi:two-component system sensor histidine kinase UhpB